MIHRRAAQACVLFFAIALGKTATAKSRFELAWTSSVPRPCIAEDELKRSVSARLGRDPFVPYGQGDIVIDGRELPAASGHLRARIEQRGRDGHVFGTRELDATSCEELRRSATFVIFLIVDPEAAFREPAGAAPGGEERENTKDTPPRPNERRRSPAKGERFPPAKSTGEEAARGREIASSASPEARARRVRADFGLALVVSNGLLPKPDLGPMLVLGLAPLPLPLRFEWRAAYRLTADNVKDYEFQAVAQEWRACYVQRVFGALFGTACGGVTWTAILPEARGFAKGDQAAKNVVAPMLALGPTLELGETRLFLDLSFMLPRPRYAFRYRDEGRTVFVHEVSQIAWSLAIGATRSFW